MVTTRHATFGQLEKAELDDRVWLDDQNQLFRSRPRTHNNSQQTPSDRTSPELEKLNGGDVAECGQAGRASNEWEYRPVPVGPNPGRYENVNSDSIVDGLRRPRAQFISTERAAVYAHIAIVADEEEPVDGVWGEDSAFVGVAMPGVSRKYGDAISSLQRLQWERAMMNEWEAFDSHNVLLPCKLPPGAKALGTTWVYTLKNTCVGSVRYKARLVAQGFAQRPGVDVNETFAPVARTSTIRYILALAASQGLKLEHFDFNTAFLNGKMTEDVYIKVPPNYPGKVGPTDVLKLIGSMYGTKQAPREWHKTAGTSC